MTEELKTDKDARKTLNARLRRAFGFEGQEMTEELKLQLRKPTIHELEALLSEENPGKVAVNADGSITVKPAWTDAELTQLVKAARAALNRWEDGDDPMRDHFIAIQAALVPFKEVE